MARRAGALTQRWQVTFRLDCAAGRAIGAKAGAFAYARGALGQRLELTLAWGKGWSLLTPEVAAKRALTGASRLELRTQVLGQRRLRLQRF